MTNDQVNAARGVTIRNPDVSYDVSDTQIVVSRGEASEVVAFTTETPPETLRLNLTYAVERVRAA